MFPGPNTERSIVSIILSMSKSLKFVPYENHSGFDPDFRALIPMLPKRHIEILDKAIAGEAPKDFIRVYEFGRSARKNNRDTWTPYIAKVARKWYPNESITEHLLNRLGSALGVAVAKSRLAVDDQFGRLRFLSEYFLRSDERLEHGAEIYAGYTNRELVEAVEQDKQLVRNFFTFQFTESAVKHRFGHSDISNNIMRDLVKMLCFDAITGNNDRHIYNWGVICPIKSERAPWFSPIYDSARGLFWNESELNLKRFYEKTSDGSTNLERYVRGSMPRIGWEGKENPNHFELARLVYQNRPEFRSIFDEMVDLGREAKVSVLMEKEFVKLFSPTRYLLIKKCLNLRFQTLSGIIHQIKKEERI
jgi:hypothetical protein